jgi:ribosomal subunit interface protein
MDIRVSGHQVETGEALRERVANRLNAIADKYFSRAISAQVTFGKGPHDHGFTCEIVSFIPGEVLKATDRAADAYAAFDAAAEKIEKQFRRHTRRLKDHHAGEVPDPLDIAMRRDEAPSG